MASAECMEATIMITQVETILTSPSAIQAELAQEVLLAIISNSKERRSAKPKKLKVKVLLPLQVTPKQVQLLVLQG